MGLFQESAKYDQVYSYKELKQKHKAQSLDICNKEVTTIYFIVLNITSIENSINK